MHLRPGRALLSLVQVYKKTQVHIMKICVGLGGVDRVQYHNIFDQILLLILRVVVQMTIGAVIQC